MHARGAALRSLCASPRKASIGTLAFTSTRLSPLLAQSGHQVVFANRMVPGVYFDQTATVVAMVVAMP